ncbi:MAG: FkbM family methyltransferase [Archangiaceae bacterium]|nr:FkbM family methyltransferase [Archangiaceae bacterium]
MKRVRLGEHEVWALNATDAELLYRQIFENQTYAGHGIGVRDGDTVFDCGANIGLFSLWLSSRHRDVKLFAFEPVPETFAALQRNVPQATLCCCALGDRAGTADFTYDRFVSSTATMVTPPALDPAALAADLGVSTLAARAIQAVRRLARRRVRCPVRTLAEVMAEHRVERIDLLKVDVEGSEARVLAGVGDWSKVRQVIVETDDPDGIRATLRAQGFTTELGREPFRSFEALGLYNVYARR